MKRISAFWAVASVCLIWAVTAVAQEGAPPDSAASDTLKTQVEEPAAKPAPVHTAAADTAAAGARSRRAHAAGPVYVPVIRLGLGTAVNHQPDSFRDDFNPSFGLTAGGGVRRGRVVLAGTFDYNFFLADGTTPDDLSVLTLFVDLKFHLLTSTAKPYVLACGGLYRTWIVDTDYTESVLGFGGGGGVELEIDDVRRLFLEGRYVQGRTRELSADKANTEVIPIRFGLTWEIK